MARKRNQAYTEEFRREAVKRSEKPGVTQAQVAKELGVSPQQIANWKRQFKRLSDKQFNTMDGVDYSKKESEELRKLRREKAALEKEVEFLKKAAVDSIDHCNTPVGICTNGGSLYEAYIYNRRKRVDFRRLEAWSWLQ